MEVKFESIMHAVSGKVEKGKGYYFRTQNGKIFLCNRTKERTTPPSAAEQATRVKFKQVMEKAKQILSDPQKEAEYRQLWKESGYKKPTLRGFIVSELYKKS